MTCNKWPLCPVICMPLVNYSQVFLYFICTILYWNCDLYSIIKSVTFVSASWCATATTLLREVCDKGNLSLKLAWTTWWDSISKSELACWSQHTSQVLKKLVLSFTYIATDNRECKSLTEITSFFWIYDFKVSICTFIVIIMLGHFIIKLKFLLKWRKSKTNVLHYSLLTFQCLKTADTA